MTCTSYYCVEDLYKDDRCPRSCCQICPSKCKIAEDEYVVVSLPPPPPLDGSNSNHSITTNLVIMAGVLGGALFLAVCWILFLNLYSKWKTSRRRVNSPILSDAHEDFLEGNHGPVVEHHIWYINTVGLQQSVIDSIMVCKFKKDEGLIEGTECSVCLSDFQEDESLRLLPKCSHAFHLPCIDTWLTSHKNCPLCRAPIVHESVSGVVNSAAEGNSDDSGSREDTQVENLENHGGLGSHQVGDSGTSDQVRSTTSEDLDASPIEEIGRISDILKKMSSPYFDGTNYEFRVQSDLANNRRVPPEQELQAVRRSVSLDSSSASMIYHAMANVAEHEEGSSGSQLVVVQEKNPNSGSFAKRGSSGSSSSIYKLMKSSSIGRSLQKKPIWMRRSFSSSGKLSLPKHSRSHTTSILPM